MKNIKEIQQQIIDDFALFEEWDMKYEHLIDLGKELPKISEDKKTENNLIDGCQSRVWLYAEFKDGLMSYTADSDAIITKGIIALLLSVYNNQKPEDIVQSDTHFIQEIGLQEHLSPTRANGLLSMIKKIKLEALKKNNISN